MPKLSAPILLLTAISLFSCPPAGFAHAWKAGDAAMDREMLREHLLDEWTAARVQPEPAAGSNSGNENSRLAATGSALAFAAAVVAGAAGAPATARPFQAFPALRLSWDQDFLHVGSGGLPDHTMMVGITAWQQQVPLPQAYFGDNAWRVPLHPRPAKTPAMIKGRFLRGAIALAVNGIPIFNPQNNRGEVSQEIGELDRWGGHCGRADDYHYHIVPLHLQSTVGKGLPVAYALDGYPIYGLTEPDGAAVGALDECHGHELPGTGYHYHASMTYPYVIGGFHGEVVEAGGQVDPQPRALPGRGAGQPLRGAEITGFERTGGGGKLSYTLNGDARSVVYAINADTSLDFTYDNGSEGKRSQTYTRRAGGGGGTGNGPDGGDHARGGPDQRGSLSGDNPLTATDNPLALAGDQLPSPAERRGGTPQPELAAPAQPRSSNGTFLLSSPVVEDGAEMPAEYSGDGSGATLPLDWHGAPAGTQAYALIMDHKDPAGEMKWYWTLYDLPANTASLPKNVHGIGKVGTGFKGRVGYEPPHSKGPGPKTYVLTLYALSAPLQISQPPETVNRAVLLAAMQGQVLATASLHVVHTSKGSDAPASNRRPEPRPPN